MDDPRYFTFSLPGSEEPYYGLMDGAPLTSTSISSPNSWRCEYCGNENTARKCVDCGAPKPNNDVRGEYKPGFQLRKVICADESSPRFGQKFLEWGPPPPDPDLMPKDINDFSIIKDIFMGAIGK